MRSRSDAAAGFGPGRAPQRRSGPGPHGRPARHPALGPVDREVPPENPRLTPEVFALALLLCSSLQIMENLLPRIPLFPWLKLGLSYVVILPFLLRFGALPAFALLIGRNVLGVLYGGQLFSTFLISTGSGAVAFLAAGPVVVWAHRRNLLGVPGISVLTAAVFNLSQLVLVEWVVIGHSGFYFQVGPLLLWSVVSGLGIAWLIGLSREDLAGAWETQGGSRAARESLGAGNAVPAEGRLRTAAFAAALTAVAVVMLTPSFTAQGLFVPLAVLAAWRAPGAAAGSRVTGGGRRVFTSVLAAWPLFFYLGWLHLFHTSGRLEMMGVTREGIDAFAFHGLRLVNLILAGQWVARTIPLAWMRRSRHPALQGFLLALPLLPGIFRFSVTAGRQIARRVLKGERTRLLTPVFEAWKKSLAPSH
jgi:uncharacterized membrane protein